MKMYEVTVPIAGEMHCIVEVPDDATEDDIYEAALTLHSEDESNCDVSWEFHYKLFEGNVSHISGATEFEYEEARE